MKYCVTHLYTNESPNWESCFFYPAPPPVSVSRSRFPGFCSGSCSLVTNCCAVPVRCLGFYLVLLLSAVCCCCCQMYLYLYMCIVISVSAPVLVTSVALCPVIWFCILFLYPGPCIWSCCICICIWFVRL